MSEHYVEVHVNVEPIESCLNVGAELALQTTMREHGFRRGKLLMDKGRPAPDAFFTWRGTDVYYAEADTRAFIAELNGMGVKVLRYKMEITLVDSREVDRWNLLSSSG